MPKLTVEQKSLRKEYYKFLNPEERVDRTMIEESIVNYDIEDVDYTGKVCLDLGGNIGGFTKIAVDRGAKKVIVVECDPRNAGKIRESFKDVSNVELIYSAVSGSEDRTIKIYKSSSQNNHCSTSIVKKMNFGEYDEVPNVHVKELLQKYKPDIIKIDIESAEYQILDYIDEYHPEFLFIELHGNTTRALSEEWAERLAGISSKSEIKELIVFSRVFGYDCWFKK